MNYKKDIYDILTKHNPIRIYTKDKKSQCNLYIGGKNGNRIYFGKPIIYDAEGKEHFMFPNEARLLNLTYAMDLHYDIEVKIWIKLIGIIYPIISMLFLF